MKTAQAIFIFVLLYQTLHAHATDKERGYLPAEKKGKSATTYEKVKHISEEVVVHATDEHNDEHTHKVVDDGKWHSRSSEYDKGHRHDDGHWQSRSNGKNWDRQYDSRKKDSTHTTNRKQQDYHSNWGRGNTNPDRYRAYEVVQRNNGRSYQDDTYRAGQPERQQIIDREERLISRTLSPATPRTLLQRDDFIVSRPRALSTPASEGQVRNFVNANGNSLARENLFTPAGRDGEYRPRQDPLIYATAPNSLFQTQINVQSQDNEFNAPNEGANRRNTAGNNVVIDPVELPDGFSWNEDGEARALGDGLVRTLTRTTTADGRSRRPSDGFNRQPGRSTLGITSLVNRGSRQRSGDLLPTTRSGILSVREEEVREGDRNGLMRTITRTRTTTNDDGRLTSRNLDSAPLGRRTIDNRRLANEGNRLRNSDLFPATRSGVVNVQEEEIREGDVDGLSRTVTRTRTTTNDDDRRLGDDFDLTPRRSLLTARTLGDGSASRSRAITTSTLRDGQPGDFVPADELLYNSRATGRQSKSNHQGINVINGNLDSGAAISATRPQGDGDANGNGVRNRQDVNILNGSIVGTSRPDRVFDDLRFASASNFEFLPKKERPF